MTRNFILAFILIFLFLFIYQLFVFPPPQAQKPVADTTQAVQETVAQKPAPPVPTPKDTKAAFPLESVPAETSAGQQGVIVVITSRYIATLDRQTGRFLDWELPKYRNNGHEVHLIAPQSSWGVVSAKMPIRWVGAPEAPETLRLEPGQTDSLVFIGWLQDSLRVQRVWRFQGDAYLVGGAIRGLPSTAYLRFEPALQVTEPNAKEDLRYFKFMVSKEKLYKDSPKGLKNRKWYSAEGLDWVGSRNKYFLLAFIPQQGLERAYGVQVQDHLIGIGLEFERNFAFQMYVGPLDYFLLKQEAPILANAYSFGNPIIAPFSKFLLYAFRLFHGFIPNYGWVIVLFAFLMKLVFWPLTRKSLRSMQKMQELKPKIDALKKIYKDDPQRMQQEMLELYKKYKVNPFSGCLPLLFQLPIFWALYQVLRESIEFRGAEFIFWIRDLSAKDPYYILPILMGVTSLVQALIQSKAQDQQSKMLALFMPIFLTVIFLNFPAGIVLYWLAYNVYSVGESLLLRRATTKEE